MHDDNIRAGQALRERDAAGRQFEKSESYGNSSRDMAKAPSTPNVCGLGTPARRGIRQRIDDALYTAESNIRRAQVAQRAQQIIDQHPEFAELLDLLNEF